MLNELKQSLSVAWLRAVMNLKAESNRTYLGHLWLVLEPAIHVAVYYVVFGLIFKRGGEGFVIFLVIGVTHWLWFAKSVGGAATSILQGRGLLLKLHIPKIVFPLSVICLNLLRHFVVITILFVFLLFYGIEPTATWFLYPLLFVIQLLLIFVISLLVAAIVVILPDLRIMVPPALQLLFFLSGVFFDLSRVPENYHHFLNLNPVFVLLQAYRDILLEGVIPDFNLLASISGILLLAAVFILFYFRRFDTTFSRLVLE